MDANVLLPRAVLRQAPTFRILETQQAAAVVSRLDRQGRQGSAATGGHSRALHTTAELLEDVAARRTLPLFSMASYVSMIFCVIGVRAQLAAFLRRRSVKSVYT